MYPFQVPNNIRGLEGHNAKERLSGFWGEVRYEKANKSQLTLLHTFLPDEKDTLIDKNPGDFKFQ